jgi:hypothetical protein
MRTTDLFKSNRAADKITESIEKVFGKKLNLESFDLEQLEDARNKLRTQIHTVRSESGFNENLENDAFTQAQWMLDAINSEIAERQEFISDPGVAAVDEGYSEYQDMFNDWMSSEDAPYKDLAGDDNAVMQKAAEYLAGRVPDHEISDIAEILTGMFHGEGDDEGGDTDDGYALASAGHGSDEDYGDFPESAPPTAKGERMVKHIKKGYANDGKITDKERSIAYATAWKQHNKDKNESVDNPGEDMTKLQEGEVQQATAVVTAKTMVDRVGRWIEELSGMENDQLIQLGDSIRDEMGQEQAKAYISAVAPAVQQALENLKTTRETLATGVRMLTGEEQGAELLGSEPAPDAGGIDDLAGPAEPDAMNTGDDLGDLGGDEFAAADAAVGGAETAGREKRESINYQNSLLKVLAG